MPYRPVSNRGCDVGGSIRFSKSFEFVDAVILELVDTVTHASRQSSAAGMNVSNPHLLDLIILTRPRHRNKRSSDLNTMKTATSISLRRI